MNTTRNQSFVRRFFASPLFVIVGTVMVILVGIANIRVYYSSYKIHQEIDALQRDIDRLQTKKIESMEILKYVTSNNFVEEKARTELNMQQPGEHVLVVSGVSSTVVNTLNSAQPIDEAQPTRQTLSNPIKWWYYFTHYTPVSDDHLQTDN
jgi:cell division protein FtsB